MDENIIEVLKDIEGISVSEGLEYCGTPAAFIKFINTFYNSIEKKAAELAEAFRNEDYSLYGMKAHSLKSTSRFIGASELSAFALKMEEAGEIMDSSYIKENHERFLAFYRSYLEKLSALDTADDKYSGSCHNREDISGGAQKEIIPAEELKDAYRSLSDCISMMDYDGVEFILAELKKYKIPDKDGETLAKLNKLLMTMEWDEMQKLCDSIVI